LKNIGYLLAAGAAFFAAGQNFAADTNDQGAAAKHKTVVIKYEPEKEKVYKMLPLGVLDFVTVEKQCRPWLSPGGLLINEEAKSSVLVYDTPGVISRIADYMRDADRNAPNLKITFEADTVETTTKVKGPAVPPLTPPKSVQQASLKTDQFVITRSGLPASIWISNFDLDAGAIEKARYMTPPPAKKLAPAPPQPVNMLLMVRPLCRADGKIELELYPEIRYADGPRRGQHVKLLQLGTKITLAPNQKTQVGAFFAQRKQEYIALLSPAFFKRQDIEKISNMTVSIQALPQNTRFFAKDGKNPLSGVLNPQGAQPAATGIKPDEKAAKSPFDVNF